MTVPFFDIKNQFQQLMKEINEELGKIFSSCSFVGGSYVQKFEQEVEEYLDVQHAIGCGNGTDALMLALRACNVRPGDEVITTPFSFFATAEAIAAVGATPVFVDIKLSDYTIDPEKIESAITERTKVILPVHIFGSCCDMDRIMEIAKRHDLMVVEDAAQAFGSSYRGLHAGTLGDIGCFSFYPTKNLGGCGDGGMCTTNNDDLAIVLRALREHGAGKNGARAVEILDGVSVGISTSEKSTELYDPHKYFNYLTGYNSRLDAIQACVLSIKLKHLDRYNARRAEIAGRYLNGLGAAVMCPKHSRDTKPCWHQFVIRADRKKEICSFLGERGIGAGTFYPIPLHKQNAFNRKDYKKEEANLPVSEQVARQSVCLPIYPELTDGQVEYVIQMVNEFYRRADI